MSVKTEAIQPAAEISLFDAFGPNASEQVQAINQRAAELSMDDMARVMGAKVSAKKKSELTTNFDVSADTLEVFRLWVKSKEDNTNASFATSYPILKGCMIPPQPLNHIVPAEAYMLLPYSTESDNGKKDVLEALETKLRHLQDVGADTSTVTVTIRYKDPKTGAFHSEPLEAESAISSRASRASGAFAAPRIRVRKTRRTGREVFINTPVAKK